jgi:hypothetical protein
MKKFSYDITIQAESTQEAEDKLRAASVLMEKLKVKEIKKLAEIVQHDPVRTAMAKKAMGL